MGIKNAEFHANFKFVEADLTAPKKLQYKQKTMSIFVFSLYSWYFACNFLGAFLKPVLTNFVIKKKKSPPPPKKINDFEISKKFSAF